MMEDLIKFIADVYIQNKLVWRKPSGPRIMNSLNNNQNIKIDKIK